MVNAAHVGGFNAGNVGIALLGDLTSTGPTEAACDSLTHVLAALAAVTRLDPLGYHELREPDQRRHPYGADDRRSPGLGRDRMPRQHLLPDLPQLRQDVAGLMA